MPNLVRSFLLLVALTTLAQAQVPQIRVDPRNANLFVRYQDTDFPWAGPSMDLFRAYNSRSTMRGPMGWGWSLAFTQRVLPLQPKATLIQEWDGAVTRYVPHEGSKSRFDAEVLGAWHYVERLPDKRVRRFYMGAEEIFDKAGLLTRVADARGRAIAIEYAQGRVAQVKDSAGRWYKLQWTARGLVKSIQDSAERTLAFDYDAADNLTRVTDAVGQDTSYGYDKFHNLTGIELPDRSAFAFTYDAPKDWVESVTRPGGVRTAYRYELGADGGAAKCTLKDDDRQTVVTFGADGRRVTTAEGEDLTTVEERCPVCARWYVARTPAGDTLAHKHSPDGLTETETDSANRVRVTKVDPVSGHTAQITDRLGGVTSFGYDAAGDLVKHVDPSGRVTTYKRDASGNVTEVAASGVGAVQVTCNALGVPVLTKTALGAQVALEYDRAGRIVKTTDADGVVREHAYNALGQPTSWPQTGYGQLKIRYSALGHPVQVTDSTGRQTAFKTDYEGNITSMTLVGGEEISLKPGPRGLPGEIALGEATSKLTYDAAGRVTELARTLEGKTRFGYEPGQRRPSRITAADQTRTVAKHDVFGRVIEQVDAAGEKTTYTYDAEDRVVRFKLAGGLDTKLVRDAMGRVIKLTDSSGTASTWTYNEAGQLVGEKEASGGATGLKYDEDGRLIERMDPARGRIRISYTPGGSVKGYVTDRGTVTAVTDAAKHERVWTLPDGQTITQTLDEWNRRTEEQGPGYHVRWDYADGGQIASLVDVKSGQAIRYRYDAQGRLAAWTDADGRTTTTHYDAAGHVVKIEDRFGDTVTFAYDASGRRTERVHSLGLRTLWSYDSAGRVGGIEHRFKDSSLAKYVLHYGAGGVLDGLTDGAESTRLGLDVQGRIARLETAGKPPVSMVYHPSGALSGITGGASTQEWTYLAGGVPQVTPAGRVTMGPAGSITALGDAKYRYRADGQLEAAAVAAGETTFTYGQDRLLTSWSEKGGTRTFSWEGASLVRETGPDGAAVNYTYGPHFGEVVTMVRGTTKYFLLTDHLGSVRKIVDTTGKVVREIDYTLYGTIARDTKGVDCLLGYGGRPYHAESGLSYFWLRWYRAAAAMFLTPDPLMIGAPYAYANGHPLFLIDPIGAAGSPSTWQMFTYGVKGLVVGTVMVGTAVAGAVVTGAALAAAPAVAAVGAGVGAVVGGTATIVSSVVNKGELPSLGQVAKGTLVGTGAGLLGAAGIAVASGALAVGSVSATLEIVTIAGQTVTTGSLTASVAAGGAAAGGLAVGNDKSAAETTVATVAGLLGGFGAGFISPSPSILIAGAAGVAGSLVPELAGAVVRAGQNLYDWGIGSNPLLGGKPAVCRSAMAAGAASVRP